MSSTPSGSRCSSSVRSLFVSLAVLLFVAQGTPRALASSLGVLSGTVTSAQTKAPLPGVRVTVTAPTGTYHATTDARGFFSITGVFADTYTVSYEIQGYQAVSRSGVTVNADQTQIADASLTKALRTIARVATRSIGGAFQPNQTTDTYTANPTQIEQTQGNAINISESQLITSLPGASYDSSGYPVIHGGRENEEGFQFEGIPYVDAFTNQFTNTLATPGLGLQSVQLTPGAGNASFGNTGTGTLNLVAKRGSVPGYATAQLAVGGPGFFHGLNLEYGTATANGRLSDYFAFNGENSTFAYGSGNVPAAEVFRFLSTKVETDREFINNLVYKFGKDKNQSLQFFLDSAQHEFLQGYGGNPFCFKTCDPYFLADATAFTGLTVGQVQSIMTLDPYQTSPVETLAQANRPPYAYYQPNTTYKLQYDNNLDPSTFLSVKYYRVNAVVTFDQPYASRSPFAFAQDTLQGGFTNGATLSLTRQFGSHNLAQFGVDYAYLTPVYNEPINTWGFWDLVFQPNQEQYDFIKPTDPNCPLGADGSGKSYCGFLYNYFPNGVKVPINEETFATHRQDTSFYASDQIQLGTKLKAEVGGRLDEANYMVPAPAIDRASCTTLYVPQTWTPPTSNWDPAKGKFNCDAKATFGLGDAQIKPSVWEPRVGLTYNPTVNDSIRLTYGKSVLFPPIGQIDLYDPPAFYTGPFGRIASYSGFNAFNAGLPAGTLGDATAATTCGIPGYQVQCANYGEQLRWAAQNTLQGVPLSPIKPETFKNYSVTLEHQFTSGLLSGIGFSIAPWYREGSNATASVAEPRIGPNGQPVRNSDGSYVLNPPVVTNKGRDYASGIDFRITKEAPVGFAGQFTASYINEFSNVVPLSASEDFFPSIPTASLLAGNLYRVGFLSPFQSVLSLSYKTRSGWRFNPQFFYDVGYPVNSGLLTPVFVNGNPVNVSATNYTYGQSNASTGAVQYLDPLNPGSVFAPNIAATRGTPEAASPGGVLSHSDFFANMTFEYGTPKGYKLGVTVNNVFNQLYLGSYFQGINPRYQPIATGISGPLTGYSSNPTDYTNPNLGALARYGTIVHGRDAYLNSPENTPRNFYFYVQARV